jgi:hypothetical protein
VGSLLYFLVKARTHLLGVPAAMLTRFFRVVICSSILKCLAKSFATWHPELNSDPNFLHSRQGPTSLTCTPSHSMQPIDSKGAAPANLKTLYKEQVAAETTLAEPRGFAGKLTWCGETTSR